VNSLNYYVNNKMLMEEIIKYKKEYDEYENGNRDLPGVSNELGEMIQSIANNLSNKGSFSGYSYKEDFISEAILTCLKYLKNFDPEKSNNPFAYITQICKNSFINFIKKQKKHSTIKHVCYSLQDTYNDDHYAQKAIDYTLMNSLYNYDLDELN